MLKSNQLVSARCKHKCGRTGTTEQGTQMSPTCGQIYTQLLRAKNAVMTIYSHFQENKNGKLQQCRGVVISFPLAI